MRRPVLVLGLLSLFVLPVILLYPLHVDNDVMQAMAVELARYGGLPYLNSWDTNFPATVYIHVASIVAFGNNILGFRTMELLYEVLTLVSLYRVSRLWLSERTSLVAAT